MISSKGWTDQRSIKDTTFALLNLAKHLGVRVTARTSNLFPKQISQKSNFDDGFLYLVDSRCCELLHARRIVAALNRRRQQDQDGSNLLRRFAIAFGLKPKFRRPELILQVSQALADNDLEGGKEVVAVIDEAHLFDDHTLEDIRLLRTPISIHRRRLRLFFSDSKP